MSSLQSIMNLDEVQPGTSSSSSSLLDKKDKDSPAPASGSRDQDPPSSTPSGHVIRPGLQHQQASSALPLPTIRLPALESVNLSAAAATTTTTTATTPGLVPSSSSPSPLSSSPSLDSRHPPVDPHGKRPAEASAITSAPALSRRSQSSLSSSPYMISQPPSDYTLEPMDHHGYGSAAASSSMGGAAGSGGYPPNHPRRPMGSPGPDIPIKLTPITGRVSRAKKGVPVHVCETCNPPKTFTRAEHLRRHQLGHQQPRFPCNQCDKAFHRQDLLTRHQQRHEQEGDRASGSGDRRGSAGSVTSGMERSSLHGVHSPIAYTPPNQSHGASSRVSSSAPGTPPTGGTSNRAMSPPSGSHGEEGYTLVPGPQHRFHLTGSVESSPEAPWDHHFFTPRKAAFGLDHSALSALPDLLPPNDLSPWTSDAENSSDQPRSIKPPLDWPQSAQMVPPFIPGGRCEVPTAGGLVDMAPPTYYVSAPYHDSTHLVGMPSSYISSVGNPLMNGFADEHTQSLLDPAIAMPPALQQRVSVRSQTPASSLSTSGHMADMLVTPAPLSHRIDSMVQVRQKEMHIHGDEMDVSMNFAPGDSSPHWIDDHSDGARPMGKVGLPQLCGYPVGGTTDSASLSRAIRNAIPSYLNVYWERFHVLYPIIHRSGFQDEQVLRCAMAAVATQYLAGKEDRIRGNQLHEFAWQEAKRQPHRNLQVMQAIFLCEYFARFRGRKAAVRPSKQFADLFSRVSGSESLVSSMVPECDRNSPGHISQSGSSFPAWSSQSSEPFSASSPADHISSQEPASFFLHDGSVSPQQLLSSVSPVYDPRMHSYNSSFLDDAVFSYSSEIHEQSYSDIISPQVLDQNPTLYDSAISFNAASFGDHQQQHEMRVTNEQRWRAWLEAEGRRRLLAACFNLDGHAAVFYQQPRARENIDPVTIPLMGPSEPLWAASTADEWAALLDTNPSMGHAQFLPHLDTILPQDIPNFDLVDQASILNAAALALPRRYMPRSTSDHNDGQVPTSPDDLCTPIATSFATQPLNRLGADDRLTLLFSQCIFPYLPAATADVYAALHHTPLQDLLAVSGDSWVFSQKVLGAPTFVEHQKRLKVWADGRSMASPTSAQPTSPINNSLQGMSSAKAAVHAARALLVFLDRGVDASGGVSPQPSCISNYWAMYVCVLIIWAFGHQAGKSSFSGNTTSPTTKFSPLSEDEAVSWLQLLAQFEQPEQLSRVRQRREASAAIVSMVRQRLEADCMGRSSLFVDAVGVMKKLEENVNWRWF